MIDAIELFKRIEKGEELLWEEADQNWSQIQQAVNYLLSSQWQKDFDGVTAGELVVEHNYGLMPRSVTLWKKVTTDRWIPVATPDVSYLESEITTKVRIIFEDDPGSIKVLIKF